MTPADGARRGSGEPERVDIPEALTSLAERLAEAEHFLGLDRLLERRTELEKAASEPGLWDDPDHAREVTTEFGRVTEDLEQLAALAGQLSDAQTLNELIEEESDDSLRPEVEEMLDDLDRRLGALELRSLFAGRVRRRRRRGRDPRRRRGHRRPGLGGDDAAHVHPLGRATRLRHRGGGGHRRARRPGCCRPPSS